MSGAAGAEAIVAELRIAETAWADYQARVDSPQESARVALAGPVIDKCRQTGLEIAEMMRRGQLEGLDRALVGDAILLMSELSRHTADLTAINVETSRQDVTEIRRHRRAPPLVGALRPRTARRESGVKVASRSTASSPVCRHAVGGRRNVGLEFAPVPGAWCSEADL